MRKSPVRFAFVLGCLACTTIALCQRTDIKAVEVTTPPTIDGIINDAEWKDIPFMDGGVDIENGSVADERTIWWIAYDAKYIYFAARCFDHQPGLIKANEFRSNVSLEGDDAVGIWIDPFNTVQADNIFWINPRGATRLEIAGGHAAKREWQGEIQAKGHLTDTGYEVEARIPWSVLRLPPKGIRDMRIFGIRQMARLSHSFSSQFFREGHFDRIPYWTGVHVPDVTEDRSIKLLPYTYVGNDPDEGYLANAGLDFKTRFHSLDVVGSINPDFRNIENQILSLDFSYFERLADESRPFFLEGNEYFKTSGDAPLYVSQRIPSTFDVGLKSFGKLTDKLTVAALSTSDFTKENNSVAVANYSIDTNTSVRLAVANKASHDIDNLGTFVSASKTIGPITPYFQYMTTADSLVGGGHRFNSGMSYQKGKFNGFAEYAEISPSFLPRLGFAPEVNWKGYTQGLFFGESYRKGKFVDMEAGAIIQVLDNYTTGGPYRRSLDLFTDGGLRGGLGVNGGLSYEEFEGNKDLTFNAGFNFPRNDPYRGYNFGIATGRRAGHAYTSLELGTRYRPVKNLQLNLSYQQLDHFDHESLTIFSANYDLNAFDSIGGRAVQQGKDVNYYLAFKRTGNAGNEYYLILGDPNAQRFRPSIVLKAVFPMNWKF